MNLKPILIIVNSLTTHENTHSRSIFLVHACEKHAENLLESLRCVDVMELRRFFKSKSRLKVWEERRLTPMLLTGYAS
jgi:ligand-binding sensor protein